MHVARQQALAAEQERLLALQANYHIMLAYERQRQANELQEQFLLHVSHELRTPLMALGSFLELLNRYFDKLNPVERTQLLTRALANYEELVRLVNGVSDAIKVTGTFPPARCEGVPVRRVVQEVLAHLDRPDSNLRAASGRDRPRCGAAATPGLSNRSAQHCSSLSTGR